jgi:putative proteasome-type protease
MTYCLGIKLKEGLVAIADTRLTSGTEVSVAEKYKVFENDKQSMFIMTSGLRSVRDKTVTYFSEVLEDKFETLNKMYEAVNLLGDQIKRVAKEDKDDLIYSGLRFDIHVIVGGQMVHDKEPKLFLLYPEGNWVEIGNGYPFTIIGNSGYGKPILRRTLTYESPIRFALKTAFLSFDSTRVSASDVGYPIDVMILKANSNHLQVNRYEHSDLRNISTRWGELLIEAVGEIPDEWMNNFIHE